MARHKTQNIISPIHQSVDELAKFILKTYGNKPGQPIASDRDLAEVTGMSRGKIREALSVLTYNGHIVTYHGKARVIGKPFR